MIPTQTLSKFLEERGYRGQIQEALSKFLRDQGFSGQLNEAPYKWLRSLGYVGTLPEMIYQWTENFIPEPPTDMADTMRIATGQYTGTGSRVDVPLDFEPDVVFVFPAEASQPTAWKADLVWHGRSQRLDAGDSTYHLCRFGGERFEKFKGLGFGALSSYSVNDRKYCYAAIRWNNSPAAAHTSIIGNAVNGRQLLYTDGWTPDATLIKRDSPQPAIFTLTGLDPEQTTTTAGALAGSVAHIPGGVTLSGANQVNQNTPPALGEGIEHMAFRNSEAVTATEYTGDGTGARALGFAAAFAMIVPVSSSGPASVVVTPQGQRGVSGEAVSGFVAGANLTVPADYNAAGVKYRVLAFRDTAKPIEPQDVPIPASCGITAAGSEARLSPSFALSGPCALEFWGKPRSVFGSKWFMPLLMSGAGADPSIGWSAGLYGYAADPDGHSWAGAALRWIQHDRLARERVAPYASINRYNLNSGIVQAIGDAVHIVLVHHGMGLWRLYINGKLAKEYDRSITQETTFTTVDGGDGIARPLHLFGAMIGGAWQGIDGEIYRAQAWAEALTPAQAKDLFREILGDSVSIPAARDTWDFRGGMPEGISGIVSGVPGQQRVALSLTPVASVPEAAVAGTEVASFTSDGTGFALSGPDAGLLSIASGKVVTTAALTGQTALDFTVTATRSGYLQAVATASITVIPAGSAGPWAFPTFKPSTESTSTGSIATNGDGSLTVTATTSTGNPRVYFNVVAGGTYELDTAIEWGNASRVICRTSDTKGLSGTTVFDVTKGAGEITLSRAGDLVKPTSGQIACHYVFVMANGQTAKILPATRVRRLS